MEQSRLVIAIALSFLVFFLWEWLTVEEEPVRQPQPQQKETFAPEEPGALTETQRPIPLEPSTTSAIVPATPELEDDRKARTITVDTPLYRADLSEAGASISSLELKEYRASLDPDAPMLEMVSPQIPSGILQLGFAANSMPGIENAIFTADTVADAVTVLDSAGAVTFSWVSNGMRVEKTYRFDPESYIVQLTVAIFNQSIRPVQDSLSLSLKKRFDKETRTFGFRGPSAYVDGSLSKITIEGTGCFLSALFSESIEDRDSLSGAIRWIAVQDRYFISSIVPLNGNLAEGEDVQGRNQLYLTDDGLLESRFIGPVTTLPAGTASTFDYQLFFGPKSTPLLRSLGHDLDKAVNFGFFDVLAKPCLWIMNFIYGIIPNYGVAIILLTLLSKILLWPLGNKSYKSMAEMKKLQPLMTEIREKYKDDKRKMNEEMMGLYRTYKVKPLGGCLPMIVQMPLFFALYRMLYEAVELRHAPFFGWISDLSAPDRLFSFGFSVPFMQPPYGIPVLTVIMGATMFLSQKMQPPPGDPAQAKMMMLMPIIFTVIFINFSSGLVLYWLVNNVLSIAQQYYITKKNA